MKIVDEMPNEGQFIAVWEHRGHIWADELKWIDEELYEYDIEEEE